METQDPHTTTERDEAVRANAHREAARILRAAAEELEDAAAMPGAEWSTPSGTHADEVQRLRDRILWAAARFDGAVRPEFYELDDQPRGAANEASSLHDHRDLDTEAA